MEIGANMVIQDRYGAHFGLDKGAVQNAADSIKAEAEHMAGRR